MTLNFKKYQGTGNDFVMLDNRTGDIKLSPAQIAYLCHRRFGIGADGLIMLENDPLEDFNMVYYNADGNPGSMCGNGGRCVVAFAYESGIISDPDTQFNAYDGIHEAMISPTDDGLIVSLKMSDVNHIERHDDHFVMNTGSPHYVVFKEDIEQLDAYQLGKSIRYSDTYKDEGINVNFVEAMPDSIYVITYERGVEDLTMSCGTGVVASSIAYAIKNDLQGDVQVLNKIKGGWLTVEFKRNDNSFTDIWLKGPAIKSFEGIVTI